MHGDFGPHRRNKCSINHPIVAPVDDQASIIQPKRRPVPLRRTALLQVPPPGPVMVSWPVDHLHIEVPACEQSTSVFAVGVLVSGAEGVRNDGFAVDAYAPPNVVAVDSMEPVARGRAVTSGAPRRAVDPAHRGQRDESPPWPERTQPVRHARKRHRGVVGDSLRPRQQVGRRLRCDVWLVQVHWAHLAEGALVDRAVDLVRPCGSSRLDPGVIARLERASAGRVRVRRAYGGPA